VTVTPPPPARCRPAIDADVATIAALRRAWTEEDAGGPIADPGYERAFAAWWATESAHRRHWVAEVAGEVVGMASVVEMRRMPQPGRPPRPWGYVHHVFVLVSHRDAGVGAALLEHLIGECRAAGYTRLVLHPRDRSWPFYERLGFRPADDLVALHL
jgi:GNAT superfamily N-acetyltransferase